MKGFRHDMSDIADLPEVTSLGDTSSLGLQVRRITSSIIGRASELQAVNVAIATAQERLAGLTAEGEPGIGKTRLLTVVGELAKANGFTPITASGDEELTGPYLLARSIFANPGTREGAS